MSEKTTNGKRRYFARRRWFHQRDMRKKTAINLTLHVLLPLLIGGLIYICWRDPNLLMFRWFDALHITPAVNQLRATSASMHQQLPNWFQFSLPDGLWVYAVTAFMSLTWKGSKSRLALIWLSAGAVLGAGSELGQLVGIVPGSFDLTDLALCTSSALLAFILTFRPLRTEGAQV